MLVVAEHGSADGLKNGGLGIWQQLGDVDCKFFRLHSIWYVHSLIHALAVYANGGRYVTTDDSSY